ncbi:uncharacterized protein CC84DRAFT_1161436 [Paraphaeosphaeria sporulosa]|uniref:Mid2 domain-containing protein n=1 Tax=Paraphaeosphaeria sporulosa TaxID=1460663 RepID=A0A177CUE1_9PLEO|nr:uncharacterized protein CC84DRAFT_1161436 [Paraphaeosphaeria sporulosa]OAG10500.1 hypothetical protein CC84DRAFT_1161436 [Paraphaeosphaeria sporulosa]
MGHCFPSFRTIALLLCAHGLLKMRSLRQFLCIASLSSHALATCFFPNGNESPADTPCNPDAEVSHCCYKNQACLSNGLCVSDPHSPIKARLHRGTCSDKTWNSPDCPNHCTSIADNGVPVYACNQTNVDSYCCFDGCECNASFETFRFPTDDVYTLTIVSEAYTNTHISTASSASKASQTESTSKSKTASAASAPASTTPTESPSTHNNTQTEGKDEKLSSNSTAIGAGVGVGVGVAILIAGLVAFLFWRRSKKRQQGETNPYTDNGFPLDRKAVEVDNTTDMYHTPGATSHNQGGATIYAHYAEAEPNANPFVSPHELPVDTAPAELPAMASPKQVPDFKQRL